MLNLGSNNLEKLIFDLLYLKKKLAKQSLKAELWCWNELKSKSETRRHFYNCWTERKKIILFPSEKKIVARSNLNFNHKFILQISFICTAFSKSFHSLWLLVMNLSLIESYIGLHPRIPIHIYLPWLNIHN